MEAGCQIKGHSSRPLTFICTNTQCKNNRLLCFECLASVHNDCVSFILQINDISKRNLFENLNWISSSDIKKVLPFVQEQKLNDSKEQRLHAFEGFIEKEFIKLIEYFTQKLNEAKEKIINDFRKKESSINQLLELFNKKLNLVYNFDSFLGIIESWHREGKDLNTVNQELDHFIKETASKQNQEERELKEMITSLTSLADPSWMDANQKCFDQFKSAIPFEMIVSPFSAEKRMWSWDPSHKSSHIVLSDNNMKVNKVGQNTSCTAVIGNMLMSYGRYKWEIEANTNNGMSMWLIFGIVESQLVKNLENFDCAKTWSLRTNKSWSQLESVSQLDYYDNKTYLLDLDLERGTFTISHGGVVILKQVGDLKNKTFFPFIVISRKENVAYLRIVQ